MNENTDFGRYLAFINCQLKPTSMSYLANPNPRWRAITISRESGSGGHLVAELVARHLQLRGPSDSDSWMIFDRNLLEQVLADHKLPARMARYMPEDRVSGVQDTFDELFGLHPPTWTLVEKTCDTILRLAQLGNVIILGRGANIITRKLDYMFHVRLVASKAARIEFIQASRKVEAKAAAHILEQEDEGRRRYMKRYFQCDIDDPTLYHLVINTSEVGHATTAAIIAETVLKIPEVSHTAHAAPAPHSIPVN
jgi:cytidylate kinase